MKHDEGYRYCAYALWLAGYGAATIANWLGMRRTQALGMCQRSPWRNRSAMSMAERQVALDELRAIRFEVDGSTIDRGMLRNFDWKAMPLERSQQR